MDRVAASNLDTYIKGKIIDNAVDKREQYTRIFYYGIVINNDDPKKANRIKVRIPFLDDNFYLNETEKSVGDDLLPWCMPVNRNFISTPENNSIVLVALMDPKTPYWGRIYMDSVTGLSEKDIFDSTRLVPEEDTYNNWTNAEAGQNIILKNKPSKANEFNVQNNVKYDMGIKGKGKNRVTLKEDSIEIYQNEKNNKKESMLIINEDIKMESSSNIQIISKKGGTKYHPLFDDPVYNYISEMNNMIRSIVMTMNSTPSLCNVNMAPNLPSPSAVQLITSLQQMFVKFNKLKQPGQGASKYIQIN